jgi:hypothetical protein
MNLLLATLFLMAEPSIPQEKLAAILTEGEKQRLVDIKRLEQSIKGRPARKPAGKPSSSNITVFQSWERGQKERETLKEIKAAKGSYLPALPKDFRQGDVGVLRDEGAADPRQTEHAGGVG